VSVIVLFFMRSFSEHIASFVGGKTKVSIDSKVEVGDMVQEKTLFSNLRKYLLAFSILLTFHFGGAK
jgi:hypothetical protein